MWKFGIKAAGLCLERRTWFRLKYKSKLYFVGHHGDTFQLKCITCELLTWIKCTFCVQKHTHIYNTYNNFYMTVSQTAFRLKHVSDNFTPSHPSVDQHTSKFS